MSTPASHQNESGGCFGGWNPTHSIFKADGKMAASSASASLMTMNQSSQQLEQKPKAHPAVKEIDMLIAKEMYQMSLKDREKALDDVHGIRKRDDEEDPNFVNSCLLQMEAALNRLKSHTVYAQAEEMSEAFVRNPHKRIMFLRAEDYEPTKAAERMLNFFELKIELFGKEKLVHKITLRDLSPDDIDSLKSGEGQLSPLKDTGGRPIAIFAQRLRQLKHVDNVRRALFYVYMAAMESTDAQIKGLVAIYYMIDCPHTNSVASKLRSSLPIHFASLHLCVNDIPTYVKCCAAICTLSTLNRARYRLHFGSTTECLYELTSFGIPRNAVPVLADSGLLHANEHQEWVRRRWEMECEGPMSPDEKTKALLDMARTSPGPSPPSIASPEYSGAGSDSGSTAGASDFEFRPNDVLFGRGKHVIDHPGNAKFRRLVDVYMRKYEEAERLEKTCIAEAIVQMIQETDGRFLRKENGALEWEEVDGPAARKKVAHAFRNRRKLHGFGVGGK